MENKRDVLKVSDVNIIKTLNPNERYSALNQVSFPRNIFPRYLDFAKTYC